MKITFIRKIELYEKNQLHYSADCNSKEEATLITKAWELRGDTHVKVKKYKEQKSKNSKHLVKYKLFKDDSVLYTLWLPGVVGYYLKVYWLAEIEDKVIEEEYVHHRWPKDYFEKKITISRPVKTVKGL